MFSQTKGADEPHSPRSRTDWITSQRQGGKIQVINPNLEQGAGKRLCTAGTICVGRDQAHQTLSAALAVAREQDVIKATKQRGWPSGSSPCEESVADRILTARGSGSQMTKPVS